MKKVIRLDIECQDCGGSGVYVGMGERDGAGIICRTCNGSGKEKFEFHYNEFMGRKRKQGIKRVYLSGYGYCIAPKKLKRVYLSGYGYCIAPKKLEFKMGDKTYPVDMTKEGVSYEEFLKGKMPKHIKQLGCPMLADQSACHNIKGFTEKCNKLNGEYIHYIPDCKHQCKKEECWKRFEEGQKVKK